MRIDFGIIAAVVVEYIIFIYYAGTLFEMKRKKYVCYAIIAAGYGINFLVCIFGNVFFNALSMFAVHCVFFRICYYISRKNAIFQSLCLTFLNMATEYIVIFMPYIGIIPNRTNMMTSGQSFILTLTSKLLYLIGIMILSRTFCSKRKKIQFGVSNGLLIVPTLTAVSILLLINVDTASPLLSIVCLLMIVTNIVTYAVDQKLITTEAEKREIEALKLREMIDYDEYALLKEKHQQAAEFSHDMREHINTLTFLMDTDNSAAHEYKRSILAKFEQSQFVEYSDNKILNIILSKKKEECIEQGIQFYIDPVQAKLTFLKDTDVVAIFCNIINNAIESCQHSKRKRIYLNIYISNKMFVIIDLKNSAETPPKVTDGILKTHKDNADFHGIGMKSVKNALKNYDGTLSWSYDESNKIFFTRIAVKIDRSGENTTVR